MDIKYPNGKSSLKLKRIKSHGLMFENAINLSNEFYLKSNRAIIYKKPTPIQVVKVDYPTRSRAKIVEAYYRNKSTTDYNGIYRGKYIDFEAKETYNLSFDFKHITIHQINHLKKIAEHGGIAFVIIYFKKLDVIYLMEINNFYILFLESNNGGKKSIPIETFKKLGKEVNMGYAPVIDYLSAVDDIFF